MPGVINLMEPIVKFAHNKLTLQELGQEIAKILAQHPDYPNEPRLQRIGSKFSSVEDMEEFDRFILDLAFWCEYTKCQLAIPGKR